MLQNKQYILFKMDDLRYEYWTEFKKMTDLIIEKNIKANIGIFCDFLHAGDVSYLNYIQSLVNDPQHFELWLHGYSGVNPDGTPGKEFYGAPYDYQKAVFDNSIQVMLEKFDYILRTFEPHWYGGDANTVNIFNSNKFLRVWMYYTFHGIDPDRDILNSINVYYEADIAKPDFKYFLNRWEHFNADKLSWVILQGHPWGWTQNSNPEINRWDEFVKVIDWLLLKEVTFIHPYEYYRLVRGYSSDLVEPSAPTGLSVTRQEGSNLKLAWNASSETGCGIDCYKVYRDGICVGLSDTTIYLDEIEGSHTYQVAAVNKNNLVSAKSREVIPL